MIEEVECKTKHEMITSELSSFRWVFGIIITIQLSFSAFVGWLSTKVNTLEINQSSTQYRLQDLDRTQQQMLLKIDKVVDKLDELNKTISTKVIK